MILASLLKSRTIKVLKGRRSNEKWPEYKVTKSGVQILVQAAIFMSSMVIGNLKIEKWNIDITCRNIYDVKINKQRKLKIINMFVTSILEKWRFH